MALECDVLYQWKVFPDYETRLTEIDGLELRDIMCDESRFGFDLKGDVRRPAKNVTIDNVRIGRLQERQIRMENVENARIDGVWIGEVGAVKDPVRLPEAWTTGR